jgi:hypothetical protein
MLFVYRQFLMIGVLNRGGGKEGAGEVPRLGKVECSGYGKDKYDILIGWRSRLGWLNTPIDIGDWLILNGHAITFYDMKYAHHPLLCPKPSLRQFV